MLDIDPHSGTLRWNEYSFHRGLMFADFIRHYPVSSINRLGENRLGPIQFDGRDHEFLVRFVENQLRWITFQPDPRQLTGDVDWAYFMDHLDEYNPTLEEVTRDADEWEQEAETWRVALATWLESKLGKPHQVSEAHPFFDGFRSLTLPAWTYTFPWGEVHLDRGYMDSWHHIFIAYNP